jgi:REP element-mobilizing transposase RayT
MPQSFVRMSCHVIFSTKNREPLIPGDFAKQLYEYVGGTCRAKGNTLVAAGGTADHVHLLVSLGKQASVADTVRDIKSSSSAWIHETCPNLRGFAWQTGYAAFAVSHSNLGEVKKYIAGQQEHHRVHTFQEEFLAFLDRHQIEHDERYIWD